ncbi:uncharacterized protein [Diabrotica undecimpunctata]|uniref:uncharacterized protein n=1 Tax=Diabrotica undecimpunctata TaxID=50387 RepID=UPI003B63A3C6
MGIDLGEVCLYTLQFADDQVIIANDKGDLEYMARKLKEEYDQWGLEINVEKTKYLPIGGELSNIELENNEQITSCSEYTYLGVILDRTGKDDEEIKKRATQTR